MEKDVSAIEDMEKWLTSLPKNKPFFAFLFLDSVHSAIFLKQKNSPCLSLTGRKSTKLNFQTILIEPLFQPIQELRVLHG